MTDQPTEKRSRLRWVTLGESVAIAALILSALGLWREWSKGDEPAVAAAPADKPIPLVLRGTVEDGGRALRLAPLEAAHALEEVTVTARAPGKGSAPFGSDPLLSAGGVESWLPADGPRKGVGSLGVTVAVRYVEHGRTRSSSGRYRIDYRWKDGGLFEGRELRFTGFRRG